METEVLNHHTLSLNTIARLIKQKKDVEKIVDLVIDNPSIINDLVNGLETERSSVKFSYEKILRLISERKPELIYPHFDFFVELLNSENNFLKWGAIITISNLTSVDSENKFEKIFEKYYLLVKGPVMITAANIVRSSWKIASAKPHLLNKITGEILKIQNAKYINHGKVSLECKNVVTGHAIDFFSLIFERIKKNKPVLDFVKKQLTNRRIPVRKKAHKFLKKFNNKST